MRNQKQNARLSHVPAQMFVCGKLGNCSDAVLSPRTSPGLRECASITSSIWSASDCTLQQERMTTARPNWEWSNTAVPLSDAVRASLSVRTGDGSISTSSSRTMECPASPAAGLVGRSLASSEVIDSKRIIVDELLTEINVCRFLKRASCVLNKLAQQSPTYRELIGSSRIAASLIALLQSSNLPGCGRSGGFCGFDCDCGCDMSPILGESLAALAVFSEDEPATQLMATPEMLSVLTRFLLKGSEECKEHAALILERLSLIEDFKGTMGGSPQLMAAIACLLRDLEHPRLVKFATKTLLALCLRRENRTRAVEAGMVAALVEMLPVTKSATAEKALAAVELLSTVEEGKAAVCEHALAIPVLVNMILRVSDRGTEYAAGALSSICSDSSAMQEAAVAVGAPTKLLLLLQSDCTTRAKRKASQLLKVLHKLLREEPCNPDTGRTKAIHY